MCAKYKCACCIALLEVEPCAGMGRTEAERAELDAQYDHIIGAIPHTCEECCCSECV